VIAAARAGGVTEAWLDACRRSPVYKMVKEWEIALPLHPEFRTLPSLFYIPPESPVATADAERDSYDMVGGKTVLPNLDEFASRSTTPPACCRRAPCEVERLCNNWLCNFRRRARRRQGRRFHPAVGGFTEGEARAMHRLLALPTITSASSSLRLAETTSTPYIERGAFDELAPGRSLKRRTSFHGALA
jgi:nitrate reductase beta subunit